MNTPKISIIVPVYNVEDYLAECLDSILSQTLEDFEIVCVNDGSQDGSGDILEEYSHRDDRIIVITQENGGLSSARNTGMKAATGKYIAFVDSDDALAPNALETLWKAAEENDSDIVVFGMNPRYFNTREQIDRWLFTTNPRRKIVYKEYVPEALFYEVGSHPFACRDLFKREFIEKNQLSFSVGHFGEDTIFQFQAFPHARNITFIKDILYYYRCIRPNSLMFDYNNQIGQKTRQHIAIIKVILDDWKKKGLYEGVENLFAHWAIDFFYFQFTKTDLSDRQNLAIQFLGAFKEFGFPFRELGPRYRKRYNAIALWATHPREMAKLIYELGIIIVFTPVHFSN